MDALPKLSTKKSEGGSGKEMAPLFNKTDLGGSGGEGGGKNP